MKPILTIFIFIFSLSLFATEEFWSEIRKGKLKQFDDEEVKIEGVIKGIDLRIRSRDNYYLIKVKDPKSENYVGVKLYTIKKLKRVNHFKCKRNKTFFVEADLKIKKKRNLVGIMTIDDENDSLRCGKKKKTED